MAENDHRIADAIILHAREIKDFSHDFRHAMERLGQLIQCASKSDLEKTEKKIMSAISDYSDKVDAAFAEIGTAVDGIQSDITSLKDIILKLQNNPGPISPEDQALLDQGVAKVTALADKVKALDAQTDSTQTPAPAP